MQTTNKLAHIEDTLLCDNILQNLRYFILCFVCYSIAKICLWRQILCLLIYSPLHSQKEGEKEEKRRKKGKKGKRKGEKRKKKNYAQRAVWRLKTPAGGPLAAQAATWRT